VKKAVAAVLIEKKKFELQEFDLPEIKNDDGLLEVEVVGICGTDYSQYMGKMEQLGVRYPVIPGHEIVGKIAKIGEKAEKKWNVKPGDRVAVESLVPCGTCPDCIRGSCRHCKDQITYGLNASSDIPPFLWGGYASHMYLAPNSLIHKIDPTIPPEEAALYVPLGNGVKWNLEAGTGIGDVVVVIGPGQQGLGCLIGAKEAGARSIIVGGLSEDKYRLDLAFELGATGVVETDKQDLVEYVSSVTNGKMADIVIEATSAPVTRNLALKLVRRKGMVILGGLTGGIPIDGFDADSVGLKEITIKGVYSHSYDASRGAIEILKDRKYPFDKFCTHTYGLKDVDKAVRLVGREIKDNSIHVTIDPKLN
jgi:alcohol dehydrogenase